jgi:hypothetical protein
LKMHAVPWETSFHSGVDMQTTDAFSLLNALSYIIFERYSK